MSSFVETKFKIPKILIMKKYLLIFSLMFFFSIEANAYEHDWCAPGYGKNVRISWANVYNDGYIKWWRFIKAENHTDKSLLFKITFRICRVKAISRKNKLSDKNCSEVTTLYKVIPPHSTVRLFDPNVRTEETLPYLKPIGALEWGFDIYDFQVDEL